MKHCNGCGLDKPLSDFNRKGTGHQSRCRVCTRKAIKNHYDNNRSYYVKKAVVRKAAETAKVREWLFDYLSANPCECGESHLAVLDFDHTDPEGKSFNVSDMVKNGHSLEAIKREVEKCVVRCANCHRKRTASQFNWWSHH